MDKEIARLLAMGGPDAERQYDLFSAQVINLLGRNPAEVSDLGLFHAALRHGFSFYYWKGDQRAADLYEPVTDAIARWSAFSPPSVDVLTELVDFVYFLVWNAEKSSTGQCRRLVPSLRLASSCFANGVPRRPDLPPRTGPYRIGWLAMYANSDNPMSCALREMAPALRKGGHELTVYAWRFNDHAFFERMASHGVTCRALQADTPDEAVRRLEERLLKDRPDILISDMNNGVPTVLFSRRLAPVQLFLQAGMPAWPVANLDGVFNSFGFDPSVAGWGEAVVLGTTDAPWDLASLTPAVSLDEIATERATLPPASRLIGSYGRLSKITRQYLEAAEQILLRTEESAFVLGGTGDPSMIRDFAARSPVGDRIHVEARFVPGHVWGHILDVMLDTWPVTGGEACREVIAKGRPVVLLHSNEMPALDLQRDPFLVSFSWSEMVDKAATLLSDPITYVAACKRANSLAYAKADKAKFEVALNTGLDRVVQTARQRRTRFGRFAHLPAVRRLLGMIRGQHVRSA